MNRKFEGFFYTIAGDSKDKEFFPLGKDFSVEKLDKMFQKTEYYNTKNVCKCPLEMLEGDFTKIPNIVEVTKEAYKLHNIDIPDDIDSINKIYKYNEEIYFNKLQEIVDYFHELLKYDLNPQVSEEEGKLEFKLKNPNHKFFNSHMIVEYRKDVSPYYPDLFRMRNSVNTNLTNGDDDINKLLAIITLSHMPVFTNTHFRKNIFSITKSPGLMTSSAPKANDAMRKLPWVANKNNKEVTFWSKGRVPNYFLESYASPLNHNAEIFCSLFPTDQYANGCIGKFDDTIIERFHRYNWVPKITMANPPYANEQVIESNRLTDLIHQHFKTITVITISRRDGTLFDALMKEPKRPLSSITKNMPVLMKEIIESPYYWNMYIIPEATFTYACLFTDKDFCVSSRKGERPTDTILIIKNTDPDISHVEDIEKIFIKVLPKDESLRIEPEEAEDVISDIEKRRDKQKISSKIMDKNFIKKLIRNTNILVSGRE